MLDDSDKRDIIYEIEKSAQKIIKEIINTTLWFFLLLFVNYILTQTLYTINNIIYKNYVGNIKGI